MYSDVYDHVLFRKPWSLMKDLHRLVPVFSVLYIKTYALAQKQVARYALSTYNLYGFSDVLVKSL